ncbi:hypothetical protein [Stackebrandtia soli]|uniref:hypothetical protein n=1 Tax=Stackebrandtia soli TaxID=1892856 RepID=UPI0039E7CF97
MTDDLKDLFSEHTPIDAPPPRYTSTDLIEGGRRRVRRQRARMATLVTAVVAAIAVTTVSLLPMGNDESAPPANIDDLEYDYPDLDLEPSQFDDYGWQLVRGPNENDDTVSYTKAVDIWSSDRAITLSPTRVGPYVDEDDFIPPNVMKRFLAGFYDSASEDFVGGAIPRYATAFTARHEGRSDASVFQLEVLARGDYPRNAGAGPEFLVDCEPSPSSGRGSAAVRVDRTCTELTTSNGERAVQAIELRYRGEDETLAYRVDVTVLFREDGTAVIVTERSEIDDPTDPPVFGPAEGLELAELMPDVPVR